MCKPSRVIHLNAQKIKDQGESSLQLASDKELASRAQQGDKPASEELVRRYQQKAYSIAYHMCSGDRQEAEDLTQEAFFRAFRGIRRFRGDSSFYTWFYRIVINTCLDGRRRRLRWQRVLSFWRPEQREQTPPKNGPETEPAHGEHTSPMAVLTGKMLSQEIRKAVMSLPERQRTAFQLKVLHQMSVREIAQVMGAAEGTVKSHLFRATRFLREELKEWA